LVLSFCLTGCGGGKKKVEGKLTQNGQPLTVSDKGVIVMNLVAAEEGKDKTPYPAEVKSDGTFEITGPERKGIPPGKYRISLQQFDPYPKNDKLGGKFASEKSPLVREVTGSFLEIDVAKPGG